MTVTIKDIARRLNTTHSTVSRVLSGKDGTRISDATRQRVLDVAREMGYSPNRMARALRGGRTQSIGILTSMDATPSVLRVLRNITMRARKEGYVTYITDHLWEITSIERSLLEYIDRHVDGVILQANQVLTSGRVSSLLEEFPAVTLITPEPIDLPFDQVIQDRTVAICESVDYLYSQGRRRIRYLTNIESSGPKINAFLQHLESLGLPSGMECLLDSAPTSDSDCPEFRRSLDSYFPDGCPDMDALLCCCDEAAITAMSWLGARGIRVPDDVAVVGFNNLAIDELQTVPLASVDRREDEMIDTALQMLYSRLKEPELPVRRVELPMKFIRRKSAG